MNIGISAKQRIEKTPQIASMEMSWYRRVSGELRPAALDRMPTCVASKSPTEIDKMFIHTHCKVRARGWMRSSDLPSLRDINIFLRNFPRFPNLTTYVVAAIDYESRVKGYTFMRAGKKFMGLVNNMERMRKDTDLKGNERKYFQAKLVMSQGEVMDKEIKKSRKTLKALSKAGMQVRFIPMPGYKFIKDRFVKTEERFE